MNQLISQGCFCLCLLICITALNADPRQINGPSSPPWLNAVGKLEIPSQSLEAGDITYFTEHCSATLISAVPNRSANIIVTAWHCLENYRDLSREISFTLFYGEEAAISYSARRLSSGGSLDLDWAILRLNKPISNSLVQAIVLDRKSLQTTDYPYITMAGYSRDIGLGGQGKRLTYHADCELGQEINQQISSNCLVYKGASGGPVVMSKFNNNGFQHKLAGVISQGNGLDVSTFIPTKAFISTALRLIHSNKK